MSVKLSEKTSSDENSRDFAMQSILERKSSIPLAGLSPAFRSVSAVLIGFLLRRRWLTQHRMAGSVPVSHISWKTGFWLRGPRLPFGVGLPALGSAS
ncbi:unnamed protein product [Brassica oleracea]|uniref:(rape) hypothetical protein n=1 Tax=Brassica napus TaxID=3708 RepID=A0A816KNP0_BRANA|nr:unnamed protein product [Brassica napus]